jgi:hypothetical protein
LGVERLESIAKLISYYRSNAPQELSHFGKQAKISESEIMQIVHMALAEPVEYDECDDDDAEPTSGNSRTVTGEIIPKDNVLVVIEKHQLWLDNLINLEHEDIVGSLGEIPLDDDSISDEDDEEDNESVDNVGVGRMEFTAEDILAEFGD